MSGVNVGYIREMTHGPNALSCLVEMWC